MGWSDYKPLHGCSGWRLPVWTILASRMQELNKTVSTHEAYREIERYSYKSPCQLYIKEDIQHKIERFSSCYHSNQD